MSLTLGSFIWHSTEVKTYSVSDFAMLFTQNQPSLIRLLVDFKGIIRFKKMYKEYHGSTGIAKLMLLTNWREKMYFDSMLLLNLAVSKPN